MIVPGLRTPRITAHRWVASITTPTPCGCEAVLQELGDLLGQALLDLQPAGVHLDDARDLGQADDPPARDVGDRRGPEERQQVVLAERVERDVLDDDHLAVVDIEDRVVDQPLGIDVVAGGQLGVHPVDALRRSDQALAVGVLADLLEDPPDGRLDTTVVGRGLALMVAPARAGDVVDGDARLADLGLDLVDEAADVRVAGRSAWSSSRMVRRATGHRLTGRSAAAVVVG